MTSKRLEYFKPITITHQLLVNDYLSLKKICLTTINSCKHTHGLKGQ